MLTGGHTKAVCFTAEVEDVNMLVKYLKPEQVFTQV